MIVVNGERLRLGLALSGGGFRASIFHMGVMRRLNELGLLDKVDVISTVSGGAIVGAYYCLHRDRWHDLDSIERGFAVGIQANIRLRALTGSILFHPVLFAKSLLPGYTRTNTIAKEFENRFFPKKRLGDLPESPEIVINTTSLNTGKAWRFKRNWMGDWVTRLPAAGFPLAEAVAASAAVPGIFPPLIRRSLNPGDDAGVRRRVALADGGVRDNQGLTALFFGDDIEGKPCDVVIGSDASMPLREEMSPGSRFYRVLARSNSITMDAARDWLVNDMLKHQKSIGQLKKAVVFTLKDCVADGDGGLPAALVTKACRIRTDLDYFSDEEIEVLKYHGYTLLDSILKRQAPDLIAGRDAAPTWKVDFPGARIDRLAGALARSHRRRLRPFRF